MSTSGSYDWQLNRDQVITAAMRKLGVLPSGGTPSMAQISDGVVALNAVLKAFHADGMPLWVITSYPFTTVAGTNSYTIGVSQTLNTVAPLRVFQALRTTLGNAPVPMDIYTRYDFNIQPQLSTITGTPTSLYYQPLELEQGIIKLWPYPSDSTTIITIHYQRPFQDMDSSTDNLDFPNYWTQAIICTLAWTLAPEFGIPNTDRNTLGSEAQYWHNQALSWGSEEGSIVFQPNIQMK